MPWSWCDFENKFENNILVEEHWKVISVPKELIHQSSTVETTTRFYHFQCQTAFLKIKKSTVRLLSHLSLICRNLLSPLSSSEVRSDREIRRDGAKNAESSTALSVREGTLDSWKCFPRWLRRNARGVALFSTVLSQLNCRQSKDLRSRLFLLRRFLVLRRRV